MQDQGETARSGTSVAQVIRHRQRQRSNPRPVTGLFSTFRNKGQKMNMKLQALAAAVLGGIAGLASAAPVNLGGLNLQEGPIIGVASVYERVVGAAGDTLVGVGEVTQLNGVAISDLCSACELTYAFGGYVVTSLTPTDITFTGGWINFYLGFGANNDFNPFASPNSAADLAAAVNGTPFLNLVGHPIDAAGNTFAGRGVNLNTPAAAGAGLGLADVGPGAGIANAFFNRDGIPATFGGPADILLGSVFGNVQLPHPGECPGGDGCLAGSATFQVHLAAIPEPQIYALWLAGLGEVGFIASRRRRS